MYVHVCKSACFRDQRNGGVFVRPWVASLAWGTWDEGWGGGIHGTCVLCMRFGVLRYPSVTKWLIGPKGDWVGSMLHVAKAHGVIDSLLPLYAGESFQLARGCKEMLVFEVCRDNVLGAFNVRIVLRRVSKKPAIPCCVVASNRFVQPHTGQCCNVLCCCERVHGWTSLPAVDQLCTPAELP